LKPNIIGIVGGVLAFVSLALPWWTITASAWGMTFSADMYLYQVSDLPSSLGIPVEPGWFMWLALVLVLFSGLLGIVGSLKLDSKGLLGGGILALLSVIIFAVGLQIQLSTAEMTLGLFSSGEGYLTYLSFGFWIALVAAIVMFVASRKKPAEAAAFPPPPPPPAVY